MWRLRRPGAHAPRASWRRSGRWCSASGPTSRTSSPSSSTPGDQLDPDELVERLVARRLPPRVPGRAPRRGRRARLDRRRVPVDRRRAGAHRPVGRRGRPAHRVLGGRPALDRSTSTEVEIFPCRELLPTDEVRERADAAVGAEPWGREQWERLAEGLTFDGMESWLPWLTEGEHAAARPASARRRPGRCSSSRAACATGPPSSSPRRPTWPATLAQTWGARDGPTASVPAAAPAVRPAARRTPTRRRGRSPPRPKGPDAAVVGASGWDPVVGDGGRLVDQLARPAGRRLPRGRGADGAGSAGRIAAARRRRRRCPSTSTARRPASRATSSSQPLERGLRPAGDQARRAGREPTSPAGAAPTAGPRPAREAAQGSSTTSSPATTSCTTSTASAALRRHGQAGHRRRRARLPAARVPGRRQALRPVRPDRRRPPLHRRRDADAAPAGRRRLAEDQGPGARRRSARSPRSSSCSTAARHHAPATPSRPTRRGSTSSRRRSPTRRRPTSSRPSSR